MTVLFFKFLGDFVLQLFQLALECCGLITASLVLIKFSAILLYVGDSLFDVRFLFALTFALLKLGPRGSFSDNPSLSWPL